MASAANERMVERLRKPTLLGRILRRRITVLSYTGNRSGRTYTMPVGYKQHGDTVLLQSKYGSAEKTWWRNFTGGGREATILVNGRERTGHAVATKNGRDHVTVRIDLQPGTESG